MNRRRFATDSRGRWPADDETGVNTAARWWREKRLKGPAVRFTPGSDEAARKYVRDLGEAFRREPYAAQLLGSKCFSSSEPGFPR